MPAFCGFVRPQTAWNDSSRSAFPLSPHWTHGRPHRQETGDRLAQAMDAEKFWSRSSVAFDDPMLEECYYAAMHGKRCLLKAGKTPPGLFFPSALKDFSLWHGDYHLNYNYQSIFLGDYESNHVEQGDAYFTGVGPLLKLGEKISRRYYGISGGCFVQLCGYPFESEDDYFGSLPLGRMAYMTGWVAAYFHRRFLLTKDIAFLREKTYPVLRRIATFYAGFLKPDGQGVYHAFPSNQGEADFSRDGALDQPQVVYHAAYALHCAASSAETLGIDSEERTAWKCILAHLPRKFDDMPKGMAPEFFSFDGQRPKPGQRPDFLTPGNRFHDWYFGQVPYKISIALHCNAWQREEHYQPLIDCLKRWHQPNGLSRAMSVATHGFVGPWTESLGIAGALINMLMTSDGGVIRVFPGIPDGRRAAFSSLRAEGAFLVSAQKNGTTAWIDVAAEADGTCRICNPWENCRILKDGRSQTSSDRIIELVLAKGAHCLLADAGPAVARATRHSAALA